jgi:hypothetical protein
MIFFNPRMLRPVCTSVMMLDCARNHDRTSDGKADLDGWREGSVAAPRASCIVEDSRLQQTLLRILHAAGVEVVAVERVIVEPPPGDLVFIDDGAVRIMDPDVLNRIWDRGCRVILLNGSLDDRSVVSLVRDHVDHVVDARGGLDEHGLLVTATKLLSGDIFGLEKYLVGESMVWDMEVPGYADKRGAVELVSDHARRMGAGRRLVGQIQCVVDELLMNALYDAQAAGTGRIDPGGAAALPRRSALLRYGSDGRYLAISVEDRWGALKKEMVVDALARARAERGAPRQSGPGGAGLGFYMILACATQVIANIDPDNRTEVICLFDLHRSNRDASMSSRAFHVFHREPAGSVAI